jgi:ribosomal protein L20
LADAKTFGQLRKTRLKKQCFTLTAIESRTRETSAHCGFMRINAGARLEGMSYSQFMGQVKKNGIELNRKVLADLAMNHPEAFKAILNKVK